MDEMRYEAPDTLDAAVALLAAEKGDACILAGGTDVLVLLHEDVIEPDLLVDIKNIPETRAITQENGGWRIGAAASGMELMEHVGFAAAWPGVIDGVNLIGSIQVRGRATVGGNLCNAKPSTQAIARRLWNGVNRDDSYVAAHPYAERKGITWAAGAGRGPASGKLIGKNTDCIIVPMRTIKGALTGVECIDLLGTKQTFGKKGLLMLGNDLDTTLPIFIVEGWADAVASWKAFGNVLVIAVFGNRKRQFELAETLQVKRPTRNITLVSDA